jgi:hypothetical protein
MLPIGDASVSFADTELLIKLKQSMPMSKNIRIQTIIDHSYFIAK